MSTGRVPHYGNVDKEVETLLELYSLVAYTDRESVQDIWVIFRHPLKPGASGRYIRYEATLGEWIAAVEVCDRELPRR